ncbi:MAG: NAD(P)-dependent glycerol-3-phosphate dehydrogenase [Proteobacteria bacterium]|nr:NAD(P)-dependent glycerol-3-phosphate dehydrogenase [Pseudomonadota bacterium]
MNLTPSQKIGIIGGGAWGTALAEAYAFSKNETLLYVRNPVLAEEINQTHENSVYLKGLPLSLNLKASSSLKTFESCEVLFLAIPAQALRSALMDLLPFLKKKNPPLIITAKGIEYTSGFFMSEVVQSISPQSPFAILSGPSFAHEVAAHYPTALTLGAQNPDLCLFLQKRLSNPILRLYTSSDILGIQIGGAIKNVIAIAAGIVIGANLGENARASLITRSLSEMSLLGKALASNPETIFGLSGLGDLLLTAMSNHSRNTSLGMALGKGSDIDVILKERINVTEGVHTARSLRILIEKFKLDLPICTAVFSILEKKASIQDTVEALLARPLKNETS